MKFERARTTEQIESRIQEILNSAIEIYENEGLERINFLAISKKTNFTRPTIYKYFETKEEILLRLTLYYMEKVVAYIENAFAEDREYEKEEVATVLTEAFMYTPQFMELYSMLFTVIEKNVSVEALATFKKDIVKCHRPLYYAAQKTTKCKNDDLIFEFILSFVSLASGLYPMCIVSELQREAIEVSGTNYTVPFFEETLKKSTLVLLDNLYKG